MYKIGICGHFGIGKELLNGQTVKTKTLAEEITTKIGKELISKVDTHNWRKKPIKLLMKCYKLIKDSEIIIILPAHRGIKVFVPIFLLLNLFFKRKIHYVVIGGWISNYLKENNLLKKQLMKFDGIHVETKNMMMELNDLGFDNVYQLSNFKRIKPLKKVELCYDTKPPYRLCTFSRVTEKKGIEDAIEAVCHVNEKAGECIFTLDIYGPIDPDYADHFNTLSKTFPSYINYKGLVAHNSTVEVLRKYTLLLFPTKYSTEGIPGTIIDAFAAGVPVVASKWDNYSEIIEDNITGIGYEFNKLEDFKNKLDNVSLNINKLNFMKKNCIEAANNYLPELIIDNFIELLDRI